MKGSIFKHFEAFVEENFGAQLFEDVLESVELETTPPFVGPSNYPDEDLFALVKETTDRLGLPVPAALRAFGVALFDKLAADAPQFVAEKGDIKDFLATVDRVIHVEVKKLSPEAYLPSIECEDDGPDALVMHYTSRRQLCALFHGLVEGAARHFGRDVEADERSCVHEGHERCTFRFSFSSTA